MSISSDFLSLLTITSSHPHASASDLAFDFWRYISIWLTLTLTFQRKWTHVDDVVNVLGGRRENWRNSSSTCRHHGDHHHGYM